MASVKVPAGHFTLLYFASASSYTRKPHDFLEAPLPITQLFARLEQKYPGMEQKVLSSCAVTLNLEYVDMEENSDEAVVVQAGDEVAIIPPVSSG